MREKNTFFSKATIKNINLVCLLLAICLVLFCPVKKEMWYDETVSVLCAKGIYYTDGNALTALPANTSAAIEQQNNFANAYKCTIIDNGNSFLYNEGLHVFTNLFGNSFSTYVLFSKLCAVATLLAFFVLCSLFIEGSIFISLALLLLTTDGIFWGMGHEIRAYEMGMLFVTLTAVFFYKYMYKGDKLLHLFLTALFASCAILSHYLSVYVILVLVAYLLAVKKTALFSLKNMIAVVVPLAAVGIYFYLAAKGFSTMQGQNTALKAKLSEEGFSIAKVFLKSCRFAALNFKTIFPAYSGSAGVAILSALFVIGLYVAAIKFSADKKEKRELHLLFILGVSSSVFLAALSIKSQHYTALYSRYYTFCIPFTTLFVVYAIKVLSARINKVGVAGVAAIIVIPCLVLFTITVVKQKAHLTHNHVEVAKHIMQGKVEKVVVPDWTDAFLLQSFLPQGYKIEYVIDKTATDFTLYNGGSTEKIKVIRVIS